MDEYFLIGLGVLALGVVGVVVNVKKPARGASSGVVRGLYSILNYRPLVKPFEKRARQIYDEDHGNDIGYPRNS